MKRFLSILLVAVLALGLMATSAFAAGIEVGDAVAAGGEATVQITAKDVKFQSCLVTIADYNKDVLELTGVKAEELTNGAMDVSAVTTADEVKDVTSMFAWNGDNGKIAYASAETTEKDGLVFTLTFKVKSEETVPVNVGIVFYDANGEAGLVETETKATGNIKVDVVSFMIGDLNNDGYADYVDAGIVLKYDALMYSEEEEAKFNIDAGDVNDDGYTDYVDAGLILKYDALMIDEFPRK